MGSGLSVVLPVSCECKRQVEPDPSWWSSIGHAADSLRSVGGRFVLARRAVRAMLNAGCYPKTVKVSVEEVKSLSLKKHRILLQWNYTLTPRAMSK